MKNEMDQKKAFGERAIMKKTTAKRAAVLAAAWFLCGVFAVGQAKVAASITSAYSLTTDPSEANVRLAIDGDGSTAWIPDESSGSAGAVLQLDTRYLVSSIQVKSELPEGSSVRAFYRDSGTWKPVAARGAATDGVWSIDCFGERIAASELKLVIAGSSAKVYEIGVEGVPAESVSRLMKPETVDDEEGSRYWYPESNLCDGDPRSLWGPDFSYEGWKSAPSVRNRLPSLENYVGRHYDRWNGYSFDRITYSYEEARIVDEVRVYTTAGQARTFRVSAKTSDGWSELGTLTTSEAGGWTSLAIAGNSIESTDYRFEMYGSGPGAGAIGEIELWGRKGNPGRAYIVSDEIGTTDTKNRDYAVELGEAGRYEVEIGASKSLGTSLACEIDGYALTASASRFGPCSYAYSVRTPESLLGTGTHYLRVILPDAGAAIDSVRLRKADDEGMIDVGQGTVVDGATVYTVAEGSYARRIEIYGEYPALAEVSVLVGSEWKRLTLSGEGAGYGCFDYTGAIDGLRVRSTATLSTLVLWGSASDTGAPRVRLSYPKELGWSFDDGVAVGYVDDSEATVTINGTPASSSGNYFMGSYSLNGGAFVTALAKDAAGRTSSDVLAVDESSGGLVTLDNDGLFLTAGSTVTIRGSAPFGSTVWIDGYHASASWGRFSLEVPAGSGFSYKRVEAKSLFGGYSLGSALAKVVRYCTAMSVSIDAPTGQYTREKSVTVMGHASGAGALRVTVNGRAVRAEDGVYRSAPVTLKEGQNKIVVKATDSLKRTAQREFVLMLDTKKPVLSIADPTAGAYRSGVVRAKVSAADASPLAVSINGVAAKLVDGYYVVDLSFSDGAASIQAKARDEAGNEADPVSVSFVSDSTPPLAFNLAYSPSAISNNPHVSISFSTTDATSGVAGYRISVDGSASADATSPYTTATLADGTHTVVVVARDRAENTTTANGTFVVDTIPPPAPSNFNAVSGDGHVKLGWDKASDDTVLYRITRTPAWTEGSTRTTEALVYDDKETTNGTEYSYALRADDRAGNEGAASVAAATSGVAEERFSAPVDVALAYEGALVAVPKAALPEGIVGLRAETVKSAELTLEAIFEPVTPMYRFTALKETQSGSETAEHVTFASDVLCTISYAVSDVPAGFPERNLGVYYYDEDWSRWVPVEDAAIDTVNHLAVFATRHFSIFTVKPTPVQELSPQELRDKGYSPLASISKHEGLSVSTQGGTARTSTTEFVLPGKAGFSFTLGRTYDTATAREDSARLLINAALSFYVDNKNVTSADYVSGFTSDYNNKNLLGTEKIKKFRETEKQRGDYPYSLGLGWRLNLPYVSTTGKDLSVVLPSGNGYSVRGMTAGSAQTWTREASTERVLSYENHDTEDFTFVAYQQKATITLDSSIASSFSMPSWVTEKALVILKDGSTYRFDEHGSISSIEDAQGVNTVSFTYNPDTRQLTTITDSLGRTISLTYQDSATSFMPLIASMSLKAGSAEALTQSYTYDDGATSGSSGSLLPLLVSARDPQGRTWSYSYGSTVIVPGDEGGGVPVELLKALTALCPSAAKQGALSGTSNLVANGQALVAYVLSGMSGPGVGKTTIDTKQLKYYYRNGVYKVLVNDELTKPEGTTLVRLATSQVVEASGESGAPEKTTKYVYSLSSPGYQQSYVYHSTIDTGLCLTAVDYGVYEKSRAAYEGSATEKEWVPYEKSRYVYAKSGSAWASSPRETTTSAYTNEADSGTKPLRLAKELRVRSASLYESSSYEYDDWGNVSKETSSESHYGDDSSSATSLTTATSYASCVTPLANILRERLELTSIPAQTMSGPVSLVYAHNLPVSVKRSFSVPEEAAASAAETTELYAYNELGQLVSDKEGTGTDAPETDYAYDGTTRLLSVRTRKLDASSSASAAYAYDYSPQDSYSVTATEQAVELDAAGNKADIATTTVYSRLLGKPLSQTGPRTGEVTAYEYDKIGRVTKVTKPHDASEAAPVTAIAYDDAAYTATATGPRGEVQVYDYDALGQLHSIGKDIRDYDGNGTLTGTNRYTIGVEYDAFGNITDITDERANRMGYAYDAFGRTISTDLPPANAGDSRGATSVSYDDETNTASSTDERGSLSTETKDLGGHVIKETKSFADADGKVLTATSSYRYDGLGREVWRRDERGYETTTLYDAYGRVTAKRGSAIKYTIVNSGTKSESSGVPQTAYAYDLVGNPISETYSVGGAVVRTTKSRSNAVGWRLSVSTAVTDPEAGQRSAETDYAYDRAGNKTAEYDALDLAKSAASRVGLSWSYTLRNKVASETDRSGAVTKYSYDLDDNLVRVTDPRETGNGAYTGSLSYDDANRVIKADFPARDGRGNRAVTTIAYDGRGNALSRLDADGSVTAWSYTPRNKAASEVVRSGGADLLSTSYVYDAGAYLSSTSRGGSYTISTVYDSYGRLVKTKRADGGEEKTRYGATGDVGSMSDGNGNTSYYAYDYLGRKTAEEDASGATRSYAYDAEGKLSVITDALNRTALYRYDELGDLLEERRADGATYEYRYDLAGNLIGTKDPRGTATVYAYTPTYKPASVSKTKGAESGQASYSYDTAGNLVAASMDGISAHYGVNAYGERTSVSRGGYEVGYELDGTGKTTKLSVFSGTSTISETNYGYAGPLLSQVTGGAAGSSLSWIKTVTWNGAGLVQSASYGNGTSLSEGYDAVGRVKSLSYGGGSAELPGYAYSYDLAGNVTGKNGGSYAYDALNHLVSSEEKGPFEREKTIRAWTASADYGGEKTLSVSADNATIELDTASMSVGAVFGRELDIRAFTLKPQSSGHRVKLDNLEIYAQSGAGVYTAVDRANASIVADGSIVVSFGSPVAAYGIKVHCLWDERDGDYRPVDESTFKASADEILCVRYIERDRESSYVYDAAGNRTSSKVSESLGNADKRTYVYWAGTDRPKTDGKYGYVYDAVGNLVEKGSAYTVSTDGTVSFDASSGEYWAYEYDLWNRMSGVSHGTAGTASATKVASYTYDPEGLRIAKSAAGVTTSYVYGTDGNLLAKSSGTTTEAYVYALGKLVGYERIVSGNRARYYTATDSLGSVTGTTDQGGKLVGRREYADFGSAGMDGAGEDGSLEWYTDKEWDEEAGLYYFNARWYDPELGRFLTEDPIRDQDNWYVYCGNNPLSRIDQTGLYVEYGPGGRRTEYNPETKKSTELNGRFDRTERPEPRAKIDAVAVTKGLAKGMLNGVVAPVKGAVSALKHPKATYDKAVRAIESFLADPFGVIAHGASATFDAYMNASPEEQAEMLGGYIPAIEFAVTAGGLVVGEPAASKVGNPLEGLPRTGSALKADPYHAFPDIIDNSVTAAEKFSLPIKGPGGQVVRSGDLYQVAGSLNKESGVFEWIVDAGSVTHRRFIPGGTVTGFPNQVVKP